MIFPPDFILCPAEFMTYAVSEMTFGSGSIISSGQAEFSRKEFVDQITGKSGFIFFSMY